MAIVHGTTELRPSQCRRTSPPTTTTFMEGMGTTRFAALAATISSSARTARQALRGHRQATGSRAARTTTTCSAATTTTSCGATRATTSSTRERLDFLEGGAGADGLDGGDGIDWAAYYGSEEGVHVSLSPFLIGGNGAAMPRRYPRQYRVPGRLEVWRRVLRERSSQPGVRHGRQRRAGRRRR